MVGYWVPRAGTRRRPAVWRVLKELGAVNARQSLWILSYSLWNRADLNKMTDDFETWDGRSMLVASMILDERHERRVVALFPAGEERA